MENQQDVIVLFNSMSPATVEFFENSFNETRFTKSIKNLEWKLGETLKVFGQVSQIVTEAQADEKLNGQATKQDEDR